MVNPPLITRECISPDNLPTIAALGTAKIAAIGPATATSLRRHGLRVDFLPARYVAEAVAEGFPAPAGQRILIARAADAREALPALLTARGAQVDVLPIYRMVIEEGALPELAGIDIITFTSSSTVRNFRARFSGEIDGVVIACIGQITARTARELGVRVDVVAEEYAIYGLVGALEEYLSSGV